MRKLKKWLLGLTALCMAFGFGCFEANSEQSNEDGSSVNVEESVGGSSVGEEESVGASSSEEESVGGTSASEEESSEEETSEEIVHTHTLTKTEKADGTCLQDGNIEYYTCGSCQKYFADEDATTELTAEQLIVKGTHTLTKTEKADGTCLQDGNIEYYTCGSCEKISRTKTQRRN